MLTATYGDNVQVHQVSADKFEVRVKHSDGKWYAVITQMLQKLANSDAQHVERCIRLGLMEAVLIAPDKLELMPR